MLTSLRADVLPSTQHYALLLLENAGSELETYKLRTWVEAASVLAQVVTALARAEEHCGFEVRCQALRVYFSSTSRL